MPNHSSRSSEKSSLFRRSKTLPTGSYRRFTTPLIPTYRYDSASDLRRDGDGGSCDSDTTNSAVAVLNSESAPSQVLATQSPSQRITKLWTHFSLTHWVCYFFFLCSSKACIVNCLAFSNVFLTLVAAQIDLFIFFSLRDVS